MSARREPRVIVSLDHANDAYEVGDVLECKYRLDVPASMTSRMRAVELAVLWYVPGGGSRNMGVHFFERLDDVAEVRSWAGTERSFRTTLPREPVTYDGRNLQLEWCAQVRLCFWWRRAVVREARFWLENVQGSAAGW